MDKKIPVFNVENFSNPTTKNTPNFYFSDGTVNSIPLNVPYRSNYFFVSICLGGNAQLNANLDTHALKKGSLITLSPQVLKQWDNRSDDYNKITILFTKEFLSTSNLNTHVLENFIFFQMHTNHVLSVEEAVLKPVLQYFKSIKEKVNAAQPYKTEIIKNLICIILYEISNIYNEQVVPTIHKQTRGQQLTMEFKKLVCTHFRNERSVSYYASLLFVTPKHLTETIKAETGRTAGEWIDETVILEAKILLQAPNSSIAQIADTLHFTDQSGFGKFFKNLTHLSPMGYRESL
jgi:AraC family transcriptional regulator, transcriptional activator of pobA